MFHMNAFVMKLYSFSVGIDFSKASLNVFDHSLSLHRQLPNNRTGYDSLVRWLMKVLQVEDLEMALVCFEHTGFYSLGLSVCLQEKDITFAMVEALELKR